MLKSKCNHFYFLPSPMIVWDQSSLKKKSILNPKSGTTLSINNDRLQTGPVNGWKQRRRRYNLKRIDFRCIGYLLWATITFGQYRDKHADVSPETQGFLDNFLSVHRRT